MKNLVNQATLICLFSIALHFVACDKKDQNDSKSLSASSNPVLQKYASGSRSDSIGREVSYYMLYLYQQGGDTSKLMQARREELKTMDSIRAFSRSGIRIFLEDGTYNPVFVAGVNGIIDSSSMPDLFKEVLRETTLGIKAPIAD
jgi:hypothetical protein